MQNYYMKEAEVMEGKALELNITVAELSKKMIA